MTTTRRRADAPALFDQAFAAIADDVRCAPVAVAIRSHAVEVACLSRELAPLVGADPGAAFAAGLLHDLGELLLMQHDPAGYLELLSAGHPHDHQLRAEKLAYGTDHALLAAEHLLDQRVADAVADAVADHHDPFGGSGLTTIVVAAADELLTGDPTRRGAIDLLEIDPPSFGTIS